MPWRVTGRLGLAALVFAAFAVAGGPAHAEKKPEKKRWEQLRDDPVDYSRLEKRRAKNKALPNALAGTRALSEGYANRAELGTGTIIADDALAQRFEAELAKMIPPGITPPKMEFIIIDDMGLLNRAQGLPINDETLRNLTMNMSGNFNARSTGGGAIIVPLGTLIATKSMDEIDFLVAHESGHILNDHFHALEIREDITTIASIAVLIASVVNRSDSNAAKNIATSAVALELLNELVAPAWDRDQERDADKFGLELVMDSGRSANGAMVILDKLETQEKERSAALDLICGPEDAGERFLKGLLGNVIGVPLPQKGLDPNHPVCQSRKNLFADWFRTHPKADDRRKGLIKHREQFYAGVEDRPLTQFVDDKGKPYDNFVAFASPTGDANRLLRAYSGISAFKAGDTATARQIAKEISTHGANEVLVPVLVLNFYVANADGKRKAALDFLDAATRAPQVEPYVFDMAMEEYERDSRWTDAASVIELRFQRVGPSEILLPRLIADWRRAGRLDRVESVLAQCRETASSAVVEMCEISVLPPGPAPYGPPVPPVEGAAPSTAAKP